jgi:hypothetical protein
MEIPALMHDRRISINNIKTIVPSDRLKTEAFRLAFSPSTPTHERCFPEIRSAKESMLDFVTKTP